MSLESSPLKTLIVDDHVLIRDAFASIILELLPQAEILKAPGSHLAMDLIGKNPDIHLIILDLYLPDDSGFGILSHCRDLPLPIPVLVLSASTDRSDMSRVLELGAVGYLPKSASRAVMLGALNLVLAGGIYVPPELVDSSRTREAIPRERPDLSTTPEPELTHRQLEVLALIMLGKSNKLIARELGIEEPTVKNHVTAILRNLKVNNRTEAAVSAVARAYLADHPGHRP